MQNHFQRKTNLPAHVVQFCRYLRDYNFHVGPSEECDLLLAYQKIIPSSFKTQQSLFKAILVKNRKQFLTFDELYENYWEEVSRAEDGRTKKIEEEKAQLKKAAQQQPSLQALKSWLFNGRIEEEKEVATYSAFEALTKKDFTAFLSNEHKELIEIIKLLARRLANKKSRRYIRSKSSKTIDLKNTIRQSLRKNGEINHLLFKEQQKRKVNLILICDVSKSMELYSQFLIEFMYSFQKVVHQLKTYVFSTQLVSLSRILRDGNYEKVLQNLSEQIPYWSGGTRIGASLHEYTSKFASRELNKDRIVFILSDGWDTGEVELLGDAMKYIQKKSYKVIWLNPLMGNPNYKPTTKGMQAALPYIDALLPFHNLESMRNLTRHF